MSGDGLPKLTIFPAIVINADLQYGNRAGCKSVMPVVGVADCSTGGSYPCLFMHTLLLLIQLIDNAQGQCCEGQPAECIMVAIVISESGIAMTVCAIDADALIVTAACNTVIRAGSGPWSLDMDGAVRFDMASRRQDHPLVLFNLYACPVRIPLLHALLTLLFYSLGCPLLDSWGGLPVSPRWSVPFNALPGIGGSLLPLLCLLLSVSAIPVAAFCKGRGGRACNQRKQGQ